MAEPQDPARRTLLTGGFAPTASRSPAPPLGPAPPWLAGRISAETCSACEQPCLDACPERIIALHPEDHDLAGEAYLAFDNGPCTFCGACLDACPEGPAARPGSRGLPPVALDPAGCLAARGVVCVICVARCPERALAAGAGGQISLNSSHCSGCGACVPACPTSALHVPRGLTHDRPVT